MGFLAIQSEFEKKIETSFKFILLELHFLPHAFGSGLLAYRINGKNVKLLYDGKDDIITVFISTKHTHYPTQKWQEVYMERPIKFFKEGLSKLEDKIKE